MDKDTDYFDIEAAPEGDDLEPTPEEVAAMQDATEQDSEAKEEVPAVEAEAVAEVAAELAPAPAPAPVVPLSTHAKSAAAGAPYPTEDPGDDTTIWSPRPGMIGSNAQGFRKIRKI